MTFYVGQKVVCVDGAPRIKPNSATWRKTIPLSVRAREIYTVSGVTVDLNGTPCLYLAECRSLYPPLRDGRERPFLADRFRPVAEKKTDISIFTAMLGPKEFEPKKVSREVCGND